MDNLLAGKSRLPSWGASLAGKCPASFFASDRLWKTFRSIPTTLPLLPSQWLFCWRNRWSVSGRNTGRLPSGIPVAFLAESVSSFDRNPHVDEMDLSKATFGLADMKLHLFCKPNFTCVWRNTFEGPATNPGKMSRQERFSALDLNAKTADIANRVLQDLVKLQNMVTFTNPPSADNSAQAVAALLALAKAAQPQQQPAVVQPTAQQRKDWQEAFDQCGICHDPDRRAELGKNIDLYTPLDGLFRRAKLRNGKPVTTQTVRAVIEDGGRGMPAYKDMLSEKDFTDVISYIRWRFP